jgi:glycosyltransferase involved in cell wall biosynthesis
MSENEDYILFLTKWYPNYEDPQLGVFVKKHAELLALKYPVKLIYICPIWKDKKPKVEHVQTGNLEEITVYFKPMKGFLKMLNPYLYYRFQKEVYMSFEKKPLHAFVNIGSRPGLLAHYHLRKNNISYSLIEHWSGFLNGQFTKKKSFKKSFYKKLLKNSKQVFAVSDFLKFNMEKELKISGLKVLPNVIETKGGEIHNQPKNTIITIGDLVDDVKNISGILHAFQQFLKEQPDYRLIIIGGGESEYALKALSKSLKISSNVDFIGRKNNDETLELLKEGKFYVCNSNFETFGMSIAEALMSGLPAISTKCGGPEEFLTEDNSRLISINSEEELIEAMKYLHSNYDKYDRKAISQSIQDRFDKKKILEKLEAAITSC